MIASLESIFQFSLKYANCLLNLQVFLEVFFSSSKRFFLQQVQKIRENKVQKIKSRKFFFFFFSIVGFESFAHIQLQLVLDDLYNMLNLPLITKRLKSLQVQADLLYFLMVLGTPITEKHCNEREHLALPLSKVIGTAQIKLEYVLITTCRLWLLQNKI